MKEPFTFTSFTNEDAYLFTKAVVSIVKEKHLRPVRIRVYLNGDVVSQYLMDGKKNDEWLIRKQNTVMKTGHSGLYVYEHANEYQQMLNDDQYAVCGGGYPIYINHELKGALCISGLEHTEDHDLILQAIEKMKVRTK